MDPDDVILPPERARAAGLTSTVMFPRGNLAPAGAVVKATSIDPSVVDADGVYRKEGPGARALTSERAAIRAIKQGEIRAGDVLVLAGCGPRGTGMEETYQLTSALKHLPFGKHVALVTDARFSGVSTGACIGHVGPEALAGGPIGRLRDGDRIRIVLDRRTLEGTVDFVGIEGRPCDPSSASARCWARTEGRPRSPSVAPRRHPPVGGASGCQRRDLGGMRLRCGCHPGETALSTLGEGPADGSRRKPGQTRANGWKTSMRAGGKFLQTKRVRRRVEPTGTSRWPRA